MGWIDWSIMAGLLAVITVMAYQTRRRTRSVADFLGANRCAGKYLLGGASTIAAFGAVTLIAFFELHYKAGFTGVWWKFMLVPVPVLIAISGYVKYRFRETRALTMAQFLEMRYSRKFRVFAGMLAFTSGILNYGVFPAVGARFFQYFCGFTSYPMALGPFEIDVVYAAIMAVLVVIALAFTLWGGLIAVMVTDFIQSMFVNVSLVVICGFLLLTFSWSQITEALAMAPADASMINPIHSGGVADYNVWFFLITLFGMFYTFMSWQNIQGYFVAARSPHDAKMSEIVWTLRDITQWLALALIPICAYTFMHHHDFASGAAEVRGVLDSVGDEQLRSQLTVSVALQAILPVGLLGLFAASVFAAFISTNDTNLHSWGSIFIQDILLPLRQRPLSAKAHMRLLRWSILGVAVFVYLFSLLFNLQQDLFMFFALTGTIFLGGSGAVIVGGLYWKRGNTAGAWTSMIVGATLALAGWLVTYQWALCKNTLAWIAPVYWESLQIQWPEMVADKFPVNAQVLWFWTMVISLAVYVVVSLLTGRGKKFNIERMLGRGRYADMSQEDRPALPATGIRALAIDSEYTLVDKGLYIFSVAYVVILIVLFLGGTSYGLGFETTDTQWMTFWKYYVWTMLALGIVATTWLLIGGTHDLVAMMRALGVATRDDADDGTVHIEMDSTQQANAMGRKDQ